MIKLQAAVSCVIPPPGGRGVTPARILKRHLWILIAGCFLFPIAPIGLTFWADPLQIFHDQPLEEPIYCIGGVGSAMVYFGRGAINRHLVRRQDRETVIFGWCCSGNFVVEEVEKLGGFPRPLNLSFSGAYPVEIAILFDSAMKCSCVKTVIAMTYSLVHVPIDLSASFPEESKVFELLLKEGYFFKKLAFYVRPIDLIKPYSSCRIFPLVLRILACKLFEMFPQKMPPLIKRREDYSKQAYSMDWCCRNGYFMRKKRREELLNKPMNRSISPQLMEIITFIKTRSLEEIDARFNTLPQVPNDFFLERIAQRPDVIFHFFLPPEGPSFLQDFNYITLYIAELLYIVNAVNNFPNVHIYAFDDVQEIVGNPANFMQDGFHFGVGVNRYILKSMKTRKHRITKANVLEYLRRMADTLLNFDPTPDFEHTVTFEGPLNEQVEKAFAAFPPPTGPCPLEP